MMDRIGLSETIEALRGALREATLKGEDQDIQFAVGQVQAEFQVGITHEGSVDGKLNVWVLELGGGTTYARESVHRLTVTLEPPVDAEGQPVKVRQRSHEKP